VKKQDTNRKTRKTTAEE